MRQNTARFYIRIKEQYKNLSEKGMNPTDIKYHLSEIWFKSPQSIGRILKTKIMILTPSVNSAQIGLFDGIEEKKEETVAAESSTKTGVISPI